MKKALILVLILLMAFHGAMTFAEAPEGEETGGIQRIAYDYDELTVATVTPFEGCFFTDMWGNVSSDLDVRTLVHGYDLVEWHSEKGAFDVDPSVVSGIITTRNEAGDVTYTVTICNDLYYSDGTRITARDYVFSILLSAAPQVAEIGGSVKQSGFILGWDEYANGKKPYISGVRLLSDDTLSITICHDYLPFFYEIALLDCVPYPIHVIAPGCSVADDGNGAYIANEDSDTQTPLFTSELLRETILNEETGYLSHPTVACGPYSFVSFDGTTVELRINEYYKGNSKGNKPSISRILYKTVANEDLIDGLSDGEIGLVNKCLSDDVLQDGFELTARRSGEFAYSEYERSGMAFISFCCERATVGSQNVRQAIAHCMDKDSLAAETVGEHGTCVDGYYGIGQWMYGVVEGSRAYPIAEPSENAADEARAAYSDEAAEREALTLDDAPKYDLDIEEAVRLLEEEGYTLDREGDRFDPGKDDVRCKKEEDGSLTVLELKMLVPEGSSVNAHYQKHFVDHLAEAGILLTIEELPMAELLTYYYRAQPRDCDMIAFASNFDMVFDPSNAFRPDGEEINPYNRTAIDDEQLYSLALEMRQTPSDNLLGYCRKWVAFQERFQEIEPMIPIYSNVYCDFYPKVLHGYDPAGSVSWAEAIVDAYMSDVADDEAEPAAPEGDE